MPANASVCRWLRPSGDPSGSTSDLCGYTHCSTTPALAVGRPGPALAGKGGRPRMPYDDGGGWDASGDVIMDFVILAVVVLVVALIVKGVRQKDEGEEE